MNENTYIRLECLGALRSGYSKSMDAARAYSVVKARKQHRLK